MVVLSAERIARRDGIVRVAVAARQLRKPGPLQAMLDAVDLALDARVHADGVPVAARQGGSRRRLIKPSEITRRLGALPWSDMSESSAAGFAADAIVVGAGLAGLVAACELVDRGLRVLILDQENSANLGGQAFWSFGGLFFVDSPEQRRLGIRDSHELALQDWLGTAAFDREEDYWPRQWAHAYVDFAAGEKRSWLRDRGLKIFPLVGWAERGGYDAQGHGNSVPRFHITWGTGPALVDIFARQLRDRSTVRFAHRHQVDELIVEGDAVTGVRGTVLEPSAEPRGVASSRKALGNSNFAPRR